MIEWSELEFSLLLTTYDRGFEQGNDSVATLQNQYRSVLVQQEERHAEEKRSLFESHLLKLSALEAQLAETQIRNEDLVQLQTVSANRATCLAC